MSLAQHVTQAKGFDYDGPAAPNYTQDTDHEGHAVSLEETLIALEEPKAPEWQHLSYAPGDFTQEERGPLDAAYKVSNPKRVVQVATGVLACWLASGIIFGFAALKPILVAEGVYSDLCSHDDLFDDFWQTTSRAPCVAQNVRLNLFFVLASISANMSSLLAGASLDRFGRRFCWITGSALLATGSLLMALSFSITEFEGYIASNILLAFGGTYIFVSTYELANAFPKHSGLIVALVTGAFDASAAVFLFYRTAYESSDGAFSPAKFFYGYLIVPALIIVAELGFMPAQRYHTMPELEHKIEKAQDIKKDIHESDDDIEDDNELVRVQSARADARQDKLDRLENIAGDAEEREERVKVEEGRQETSVVWGVLHGVPFSEQVRSPWYILILLLTAIQMFRMNYFIATLRGQYNYMLGSQREAESINHFFDAALPIGGIVATPVIGILLNNISVESVAGLLTFFIIAVSFFNCLPHTWAGYVTVVFFVLFRPLYYSAISDYAAKVFGFATFGRIYGTITCASGLTNIAQSGLDALVYGPLHGNPVPVNIALGVAGATVGLALTAFVAVQGRVFVKHKAEIEEDDERERLLGENGRGYGTTPNGSGTVTMPASVNLI